MKKIMVLISSVFLLQMNVSLAQSTEHSTVDSFQDCFNETVTNMESELKGAFNFAYKRLPLQAISYSKNKGLFRRHRLKNVSMLKVTVSGVGHFNDPIKLINDEDLVVEGLVARCRKSDKEDIKIIKIDSIEKSFLIGKGKNRYVVSFFSGT